MDENLTAAAPRGGCFLCNVVLPMIDQMWSQMTNDHFRNARVEFLKGIRALVDKNIDALTRHESKGTRVVVE
jgi:hypothetical protein